MARVAVTVAQAELSADAKRAEGRKAQARGETAATINAAERAKALGAEVVKLRRSNPGLTKTDLARILSERGFGGQHAIKKIIS